MVCGGGLLAAGCDRGGEGQQQAQQKKDAPPVEVSVLPVRLGQLQSYVDVTGTLHGEEDAAISVKVSGRVAAIYKDVGDRVAPNEVLAELEKTDYELMVRQRELALAEVLTKLGLKELPSPDFDPAKVPTVQRAKLQADNATAQLNRSKQLHQQNPPLISDQEFANVETAAAVAHSNHDVELLAVQGLAAEARARKADLDLAHQSLIAATIRAPLPGQFAREDPRRAGAAPSTAPATVAAADTYGVSSRLISVGEFIKEGTAAFRLVDDDPVKLRATAPERHVAEIRPGQKVRVRVEAYDREFWGQVSRTNPQIDPLNRMFQFEVLVENPERLLKPGGFARASVMTSMQDNVVFVPQQAVYTFAGVSKVFVVREGKAAEAIVETGQRVGDEVQIVKGLKGAERVAVTGVNRLTNGSAVALVERSTAARAE
jgi:multidrug efflux pump subunit AcrA (membrane-fusion protein)